MNNQQIDKFMELTVLKDFYKTKTERKNILLKWSKEGECSVL